MFRFPKVGLIDTEVGLGGHEHEYVLHTNFPQTKACPNLLLASSILFGGKYEEIHASRIIGGKGLEKQV